MRNKILGLLCACECVAIAIWYTHQVKQSEPFIWWIVLGGFLAMFTLTIVGIISDKINQHKAETSQEDLDRLLEEAKQTWNEYVSTQEVFGEEWRRWKKQVHDDEKEIVSYTIERVGEKYRIKNK
jgi:hypothetical protein